MRRKNPNIRKPEKGRAAESFPVSPVIDKSYEKRGNDRLLVDETETLGGLMNVQDGDQEAKYGIVDADDTETKYETLVSPNGSIISDSNDLRHYPLYVYSSNIVTATKKLNITVDTTFKELFEKGLEAVDLPEIYETWGNDGMQWGNARLVTKDESELANKLGEEYILLIKANHHLQIKVNAINSYENQGGSQTTNSGGLEYAWKFSSGEENWEVNVMDKVVGTTSVLDIEDIQRGNIGRYTCHVSNKWGTVFTKTVYVHVERPGIIKEETRIIEGIEFPTGQTIFEENLNELHDDKFKITDDKVQWNEKRFDWVEVYWNSDTQGWREEEALSDEDEANKRQSD